MQKAENNKQHNVSWTDFDAMIDGLCTQMEKAKFRPNVILGITKGGIVPAVVLCYRTGALLQVSTQGFDEPIRSILIVDDVSDTGRTLQEWVFRCKLVKVVKTATLFIKEESKLIPDFYSSGVRSDVWINFPWEMQMHE
jgi:hypothetical protein